MIDVGGKVAVERVKEPKRYRRFGLHNARIAFRDWRRSRPFWGGLWCILGGALIAYGPTTAIKLILVAGTVVWAGILVGLLVLIFGLFLWFSPQNRHFLGVLAVLFSTISFITSDFGGFLLGMTLGIIGGSMGFAWVPLEPKVKKDRKRRRRGRAVDEAVHVAGVDAASTAGSLEVKDSSVEGVPARPGEVSLVAAENGPAPVQEEPDASVHASVEPDTTGAGPAATTGARHGLLRRRR